MQDQRADPRSTLHLVRDLIALRREHPDLRTGAYRTLDAPDGVWAYRRGDRLAVLLNLSDAPVRIDLAGRLLITTDREWDENCCHWLELPPRYGAVLDLADPAA